MLIEIYSGKRPKQAEMGQNDGKNEISVLQNFNSNIITRRCGG